MTVDKPEPDSGESISRNRDHAICAVGLTKSFGEFTAVDRLDLSIEQGELFALLGPNGAGKTTTIKMLCCLLRPTAGSIAVLGHDVLTDALSVKRMIAVSPQETAIAEQLNARENLRLMAGLHGVGKEETARRSAVLLEMFGLEGRATGPVRKFSGGMKRRLSVAMALVSDPDVLFLDEPTIGLDPQSRRGMWEHIEALKGDKTIVLTTHYLEEADALADRIAIVDEGRLVALGSPTELKEQTRGAAVTVIEVGGITAEAIAALRTIFPTVTGTDSGVEIEGDDVRLSVVEDCLRPFGIEVRAAYERRVSLDDVFLDLTGKALRE